jgi:cytochrome c553
MTPVNPQLAFLTAIVAAVSFAAADFAVGADAPRSSTSEVQAKIRYCQYCHGSSGQGYYGVFPIPRIAGQTTVYIESQLRAFAERQRGDNIATILSKTHDLTPTMRTALAAHFQGLNPKPLVGAPGRLIEAGKKIYDEGVAEVGVPGCAFCHGQDATGNEANARLAGQLYPYTVKQLVNWSKRAQNASTENTPRIMVPISQSMTRSQIEAVAAYVNSLK